SDEDGNRIDSAGNVLGADGEVIRKSADFTEGIIHLPTPDWLSTRLVGNKGDFTVRKSSLNTIFQGEPFFLPSVGPLVQYPVNEVLVNAFPEFADNPVAKYILPTGTNANSNPIAQTAPSTARNLWTALATDLNDDRFAQTYMKLMADEINAQESGQAPQRSAAELQKLVTNRARNWYLVSALGSFSGFTVTPTSRLEYWRNEYRRYQREYAGDAKQKFYDDHPDYFEATISLSENETGITATDESWRAAEKYSAEIKANPEYGWMFVGAENMVPGFDAGVYTAQKALGQRTTKDPGEALRDMEIQRGWLRYQRVAGALELKLQEREEHGGSGSLSAKSNSDLKAIKDKFVSTLADENPAWANAYEAGGTGSAIGEFLRTAMQAVADRPELADRADFQTLFSYIALRRQVQQELADRGLTSLNANDATDLRDAWVTSVQRLVRNDVGFEQMYTRARLERDDLTLMRDSE
ncbi:MAG: hypothetical protein HGA44_15795, partial [Cellulomonadaceae bacterium]|nr:hypothetical protein [Cellulomonadaceae bacterium]